MQEKKAGEKTLRQSGIWKVPNSGSRAAKTVAMVGEKEDARWGGGGNRGSAYFRKGRQKG